VLSASSSHGNSRYASTNYPSALLEYQSDRRLGCPPVFRYGYRRIANAAAGCEYQESFSVHTASTTDATYWMILPSFSAPGGLPFIIFGSLLAEEPGWRGFAQPRLQMRYGALAAGVVVGLLWSTWHLWYLILPDGFSTVTRTDAVATYLRLTSIALIYAWMYNSTNGSLLIAMIAHLGHNLAASLIPTRADAGQQHLSTALLYLVATMIVVFTTNTRTLRVPSAHAL